MYCTKCGAQLPDGTRFCGSCGAPTGVAPVVQQPAAQSFQPQTSSAPAYAAAPAYASPAAAKKKPTALIAAIVAVVVVALVAGIAIASGAFKSKPALQLGSYDLTVYYEGNPYSLFNAYVRDDMTVAINIDSSSIEPAMFSEIDRSVPDCREFEAATDMNGYEHTVVLKVPEGIDEGRFDGLWYISDTDESYTYGAGVYLTSDGKGFAFLLDTGNGVKYLNSIDEAYGLMDDQQFPITWRQTSPSTIEGSFEYYEDIVDFTVTIPQAE